nr:MAG TPA: hypothetical protein [Caudoviricetes sp.]
MFDRHLIGALAISTAQRPGIDPCSPHPQIQMTYNQIGIAGQGLCRQICRTGQLADNFQAGTVVAIDTINARCTSRPAQVSVMPDGSGPGVQLAADHIGVTGCRRCRQLANVLQYVLERQILADHLASQEGAPQIAEGIQQLGGEADQLEDLALRLPDGIGLIRGIRTTVRLDQQQTLAAVHCPHFINPEIRPAQGIAGHHVGDKVGAGADHFHAAGGHADAAVSIPTHNKSFAKKNHPQVAIGDSPCARSAPGDIPQVNQQHLRIERTRRDNGYFVHLNTLTSNFRGVDHCGIKLRRRTCRPAEVRQIGEGMTVITGGQCRHHVVGCWRADDGQIQNAGDFQDRRCRIEYKVLSVFGKHLYADVAGDRWHQSDLVEQQPLKCAISDRIKAIGILIAGAQDAEQTDIDRVGTHHHQRGLRFEGDPDFSAERCRHRHYTCFFQ